MEVAPAYVGENVGRAQTKARSRERGGAKDSGVVVVVLRRASDQVGLLPYGGIQSTNITIVALPSWALMSHNS